VLLSARENRLSVTGTDLEVELVATKMVSVQQAGDITIPGRKLLDIFKSLPEKTSVTLSTEGERVSIRGGRSRFTLSSLPATDFPVIEDGLRGMRFVEAALQSARTGNRWVSV